MDEINIARFAGEAQDLLRAGRTALGGHDLTRSLTDGIPDGLDDASTPKLVFCGQYSAGKSSLIKLLTGQDVATWRWHHHRRRQGVPVERRRDHRYAGHPYVGARGP